MMPPGDTRLIRVWAAAPPQQVHLSKDAAAKDVGTWIRPQKLQTDCKAGCLAVRTWQHMSSAANDRAQHATGTQYRDAGHKPIARECVIRLCMVHVIPLCVWVCSACAPRIRPSSSSTSVIDAVPMSTPKRSISCCACPPASAVRSAFLAQACSARG